MPTMCISYQNPTQREQNSDEATCNAKLKYMSPAVSASKQRRLDAMSLSPNEDIRVAAAGNPMTPLSSLVRLADDVSERVRGWVLRNPSVPLELILRAQKDSSPSIRAYANYVVR